MCLDKDIYELYVCIVKQDAIGDLHGAVRVHVHSIRAPRSS